MIRFVGCLLLMLTVLLGLKKSPDAGISSNYADDDCIQKWAQIKVTFRALPKDDILQPYTSEDDFRSSNPRVVIHMVSIYDVSKNL